MSWIGRYRVASLPEVLRLAGFRRYVAGSLLLTTATLMQEVVIGYRLFELTGDPLVLGLVGLAEVLPILVFGLYAGHYADGHRKLPIMRAALLLILVCSLGLAWAYAPADTPLLPTPWLAGLTYLALALVGLARAFYNPAGFALKTALVPPRLYGRAAAWSSSAWQMGAVAGPAGGGIALALMGGGATLLGVAMLVAVVVWLQAGIIEPPQANLMAQAPAGGAESLMVEALGMHSPSGFSAVWSSLREGLSFVFATKPILYAISLDLFSVLFGGVMGILPVFAKQVLASGPEGLGVLRAAPGVGSIVVLLLLTRFAPRRHIWSKLLGAVMGFGFATIGFALSRDLWLSAFLLLLTGGFDAVSVVIRSTLLQTLTPPPLRGRVAAVNGLFVSTSNELGAFESGLAARFLGPVPSVVAGGVVTLVVVSVMWLTGRDLRRKDPLPAGQEAT